MVVFVIYGLSPSLDRDARCTITNVEQRNTDGTGGARAQSHRRDVVSKYSINSVLDASVAIPFLCLHSFCLDVWNSAYQRVHGVPQVPVAFYFCRIIVPSGLVFSYTWFTRFQN